MTPSEAKMFNMVSQNAHWLTGMAYFNFFVVIHKIHWLVYAMPIYWVLTAWKEFWYDARFETAEIRGDSVEDFAFYQIGWIAALLIYILL